LVLDDEGSIREMGRRFLEKAGYGCVEADSVDAALEALRTTPVVAAILDVRLPGPHSGLDMLVAFREIEEFKAIPILIMTGSVLTEIEQATVTKHRAVLFYKPEGFSTIVGFLDQLTGRDRSH
jgi:DNA-binding response OmpR family regulator